MWGWCAGADTYGMIIHMDAIAPSPAAELTVIDPVVVPADWHLVPTSLGPMQVAGDRVELAWALASL